MLREIRWVSERVRVCVEWIQLAQERDRWQALANMVMILQVLVP
jgi:hypothetical protein